MWARMRELATACVFFIFIFAFQPTASGGIWTDVPLANLGSGDAAIIVLDVQDDYVTVDLAVTDPDVIHLPIYLTPSGSKVVKGVLHNDAQNEDVLIPLVCAELQGESYHLLALDQDWPQQFDELMIHLDEQDWPQSEDIIIPLDFQDWPQTWVPAELA
ncbi:MAG: hypothetical protein ACE5IJ_02390 [Thermoplasmata archaeon]